jgi:hypothetical protein
MMMNTINNREWNSISRKFINIGLAVLLAILAALPARTFAKAEGEEPPATNPAQEATIAEGTQPETAQTESQEGSSVTTESSELQINGEEIPLDDIASALEENEMTLVDSSGQPMNLASQESAAAMVAGDPWWISGGIKYAVVLPPTPESGLPAGFYCPPGTTYGITCTENSAPINEALRIIDTNNLVPTDGILNVESGNFSDVVVIDGLSGNGKLASLKGLLGLGPTVSNLTGSISVSNTLYGFTLSGFTVDGGVSFENNTGNLLIQNLYIQNDSGDGLVVENQNGTVELKNVQSRGNKGDGARIDNSASVSAPVKITNSAFDNNDDGINSIWNTGLKITTNGAVTLEGVAASRNNGSGADIRGFSALTINNSLFDSNNPSPYSETIPTGYGLYASTTRPAAVKISNVFAYFNANHGIEINTAGTILMNNVRSSHSSLRTGAIDSTGETVHERLNEDNKLSGDRWYFSGTNGQELEISLSSLAFDTYLELHSASDDSLLAFNDDNGGSTNSLIEFTLAQDGDYYIVVKMLSTASGVDGSYILALNDPTNSHESTRDSNIKGALLNTTAGAGTVTINNSMFQDNVGDGLEVNSKNSIFLNTTDISHNSMRGAYLDNCQFNDITNLCLGYGKVSVTSTSAAGWYGGNYFLDNGATGLEVKSKGFITLTNTGAYDNLGSGMDLQNDYGTAGITINSNVTNFTNVFRNNGADGLKIASLGTLTVQRSEADFNGGYGYYLTTKGLVNLRDISASNNGKSGLLVNNQVTGSTASVNLTATTGVRNTFNLNGSNDQGIYPGFEVRSYGVISLTNIDAHKNYWTGVQLSNTDAPLAKTITLTDSDTSENQGSGLLIYSKGAVNLKGVTSSHNSLTGSDIVYGGETVYERLTTVSSFDNWWFTAPPGGHVNIILESTEFNGYLELYDASGNLIAWDDNSYGDKNAQIDIDLPSDGKYYIHVSSADLNKGNYTLSINDPLKNYKTFFSFIGAFIGASNDGLVGTGNVTLLPTINNPFNTFNDNNYQGIQVIAKGTITANNLSASDNGDTGAFLSNQNGLGTISVLTNDKTTLGAFNSNSQGGIYATSARSITLRNISADYNGGNAGVAINNCLLYGGVCQGVGTVSINSSNGLVNSFSNNQRYGLLISSNGNVTITNISANANGRSGLFVKNQYAGGIGNVLLNSSLNKTNTFLTNGWASPSNYHGMEVYSNGNISITKALVQTTYGTGALLQNQSAVLPKTITIIDSSFDANQGFGLDAYSKGAINLQGVNGRYNSIVSGQIDPFGETINEHLSPNYDSDRWWFDGNENDLIDIILSSDEFDVILEVFNKNNELVGADDDSYGGTNARLTINLPADGEYYIKVRQNGEGDGNYTLSLNDETRDEIFNRYEFDGVYLDNRYGTSGVTVKSTSANPAPNYYHNNHNGLSILTNGAVTLSNVYAMQNGGDGANIKNAFSNNSVTVNTLSTLLTSSFSYNSMFGLWIQSKGLVTIRNSGRMYLRDNGYSGAYIDNSSIFSSDINVSRVEVNNNVMKGMEIYSRGNVTLNNILAINNLTNGVYVDNCGWDDGSAACLGSGVINILGTLGQNTFSDNKDTGLFIVSNGSVTLDRVFAIQNGKNGIKLDNGTGTGFVRISNTVTRLNAWDGVNITTQGAVTLRNLHSMSNGAGNDGDGLYLRAKTPALMIFYTSSFIGNEGNGIEIAYDSYGVPSLLGVSYFGNDTDMDGDLNYYGHIAP